MGCSVPLEHHMVHALLGQVEAGGQPGLPGANDDDINGFGRCHRASLDLTVASVEQPETGRIGETPITASCQVYEPVPTTWPRILQ